MRFRCRSLSHGIIVMAVVVSTFLSRAVPRIGDAIPFAFGNNRCRTPAGGGGGRRRDGACIANLEDWAVPVVAHKITPRAFAIWRPKIYRDDFRCTIGLGALYNYSLVRTKRSARAHILSITVKVCG